MCLIYNQSQNNMNLCLSGMSCWEPMKAVAYMMAPGAVHHLSAKVQQENIPSEVEMNSISLHQ